MTDKLHEQTRRDALVEFQDVIEDTFYVASLFRSIGDIETARRVGDLGDKMHEEWLRMRAPQVTVPS